MPKRACPFDEDLSPQLKTHVGQKEVNNGVSKDERMKQVYDRTLNLLKEGAKELAHRLNESDSINSISCFPQKIQPCLKSNRLHSKQMILNNKLQLENSDKKIQEKLPDLCGCCRIIESSESSKCRYCDQVLCSGCLTECSKCTETYCQNCSFIVYENGEHTICLSCYE
ncbi:apoptosis regulatory protein Siva [Orussus abietinus]|uniref:apoptosis regulatory protein Siva n=1 Tax=Orussus abietinus TaxID=222816 RepID=UPI000626C1A5|nr:apoptosis regulatory protein Siva [Orussus abietinus]